MFLQNTQHLDHTLSITIITVHFAHILGFSFFFFSKDPFMDYESHTVDILLASAQGTFLLPVSLGGEVNPS